MKVAYNGKVKYHQKAKNCHFVDLDFEEAYKYYYRAIESYDNAIKSLELLFSLVLSYKGGIQECVQLLSEFQPLFYNINDFKKHQQALRKIQN
mmetsp:Transcript_19122/g.18774  ORF Transcript_19122/g.18774 Transcript_19122/m.18774 type:complete len:93 (-) Transcript_19122:633-911(-)